MKMRLSIVFEVVSILVLAAAFFAKAQDTENELDEDDEYTNQILSAIESVKQHYPNITEKTILTDIEGNFGTKFHCELYDNPGPAKTVHELTPYDIQVTGALGDSITAAFGAKACTLITLLIESRGVSWSIGGDKDLDSVTTIPNIIKKYNPDVKGYSTGTGKRTSKGAHNNVAVSGAVASDMPDQARYLVNKMKSNPDINFEADWKLVTIWIGGNDLCKYCDNKNKYSVENYVNNIREALDILHAELPRTFVNLVQIIDVTRLKALDTIYCKLLHLFVCTCAGDQSTSIMSTEYQEAVNELIESGRYDTKDDFTVVVQPFFEGLEVPRKDNGRPDTSYFAPDCFHFSQKAQKEGATALWNNMVQPVGSKNTGWELGGDITCPTAENPYFFTAKNSDLNSQSTLQKSSLNSKSSTNYVAMVTATIFGISFFVAMVIAFVVVMLRKMRKNQDYAENAALLRKEKL